VQAFVAELSDQQLWAEMERENRARANLSAWEQGMMYRRALDAGLFPSMRKLAEAIGRSVGAVSDAMAIAQLPPEVIEAFGSPGLIQFRYARELKDAVARDETAAREMARSLTGKGHPAAEVFQAIAAVGQPPHGVQRLNTLGVPPAQVLDAIPGTPSLHPVRPLRSSGPSKSRPNAASSVQRSNTLARQPPVLMAEHKGTPVEVDTQRQPANAGEVFVRGRGTSRWQRVPAGALKLLGFTRS
jgi:ParB-like chromosome segregation protein Spo0J